MHYLSQLYIINSDLHIMFCLHLSGKFVYLKTSMKHLKKKKKKLKKERKMNRWYNQFFRIDSMEGLGL